jgi:Flp pilus assembly protein TadD
MLALPLLLLAHDNSHQHGVELFNQHKYLEAVQALTAAASAEAKNSAAYRESAMLIAQSYFSLSQWAKVIPWLESIPPTNESSYMLGYAYHQAGQRDKSVAAFAQLFGLKPDSAAAHLLTAQLLLKKELNNEGAEEAAKALTMDPKIPEAHYVLAEVEMFRGDAAASISDLKQELMVNPSFSMAWYRLGDAYTRVNDWDAAIPHLQRAVWLNPNFSGPYILLGKCYLKRDDSVGATRLLRQALRLDPNNYTGTFLLGRTLIATGNEAEGKELVKRSELLRARRTDLEKSR